MNEENKILVNAIGSVLDNIETPVQLSELVSMLNGGYLEAIGEESIDTVTEEVVAECINQKSELFDNYFGIISLKNQRYYSIDEIESEIKKYLDNSPNSSEIDFVLFFLLFHRYAAVQDYFDLKELQTGQLIFRTYKEPERLNCDVIKNLIDQYSEIYGGDSCKEDFRFDNEELINKRLTKLAEIVRKIDWRATKLSIAKFDELISNLKIYYRFKERSGELLTPKFSQFILELIDFQGISKIAEIKSNLLESINSVSEKIGKKVEIEISSDQKTKVIQSGLRIATTGYPNTKVDCSVISPQKKDDCDILVSFPPYGNLSKSFWAKKFSNTEIEISSLEELYTRLAFQRLNDGGKAYLILPENFLSGKRKSVSKLRKDLTEKGWIDSVIKLPRSWILPQTVKSVSLVILNLNSEDSTYFFDMTEFQRQNQTRVDDLFYSATELIRDKISLQNVARSVELSSILELNCNLSVHKHINPIHYAEDFLRNDSEVIKKLSDTTQRIRPERHKVTSKYPFINMAELADDASNFVLDLKSAPNKQSYSTKQPLLKEDALLIGTIGGVLKPTIFQYKGTPILLGSNVIALRVDKKEVDMEYLISELNSKFVEEQVNRLPKGTTIPHIKKSDLLNIAIRIPNKSEQAEIFNEWISSVAKEKIKEIESLHKSIKIIEKDVFSSFAHDFGKLLHNVSGNIDVINNYLTNLAEKGKINLDDSIFFEEETVPGESIGEVLNRLRTNQEKAQDFLQNEVQFYTDSKENSLKEIILEDVISDWVARQDTNGYSILIGDIAFPLGDNSMGDFGFSYPIKANRHDIYAILNNFLSNAKEHGFTKKNKQYNFAIYLESSNLESGNVRHLQTRMHIANNGEPFPSDFTCKDFFTLHHKGPKSTGFGKGGYSIKRRLDNIGATIECDSDFFSIKEYPVRFQISFKPTDL
ncbi:MAG: N-6 DNA methylase [Bacteroidetes bacterium]|jgi:hypothetical protein|nr:N-6 DNA methylase [Bacteroidota bacterium]